MNKYVALAIFLIVIIIIATPVTYVIAQEAVSDAVFIFGFDSGSASFQTEPTVALFTGNFTLMNRADIPLTVDYANITVFVSERSNSFNGKVEFFGASPLTPNSYFIGSIVAENKFLPANSQVIISASSLITSEDVLNLIHAGNYSVLWTTNGLIISGWYLCWHITPRIAFQ